jgi:hypothetical protein
MSERVVFYKLSQKFVNTRTDVPLESQQIVYHSLALGHFLGIVDCLSSLLEIPRAEFEALLDRLPEGVGRDKLHGVCRWGEIEINATHAADLISTLQAGMPQMPPQQCEWAGLLVSTFETMQREPALYMIVRTRP